MLSQQENERLTRVGPGTPAGEMLRRYWWPVGFSEQVPSAGRPSPVRILCEDLVLFRDGAGQAGLLGLQCSHRSTSLEYGRIELQGVRCAYHGWLYDIDGRCIEQPQEPEDSTFKERILHRAYPTQEMGGLVFAYLGPAPAPILPKYDLLLSEEGERVIGGQEAHCNWLQQAENTVDQAHLTVLHAPDYPGLAMKRAEFNWERNAHGISCAMELPGVFSKPRMAYYVFPTMNTMASARVGRLPNMFFRYRVPNDDSHSTTYWINVIPDGPRRQRTVGLRHSQPGVFDQIEDDWWGLPSYEQDRMAMETQGSVTDRSVENVASSDRGVMMLREMVREAVDLVEEGGDPLGVLRDPAQDNLISFDLTIEEMATLVGT